MAIEQCSFDDLYIGSVSGGNYQIVHLDVRAKDLNEPFKEMLRTHDAVQFKLKDATEFIERLGEGNFSPEDYDGDCYEAIKGACEKFLKVNRAV